MISRIVFRNVGWHSISFFISALVGLSFNWLILIVDSVSAVGVFNQTFAIYVVIGQLSVAGLQFSTLQALTTQRGALDDVNVVVSAAAILTLMTGSISTVLLIENHRFIGQLFSSSDVSRAIVCAAPAVALYPTNKVLSYALNGMSRLRTMAVFQTARPVLICLSLSLLLVLNTPSAQLAYALTFAEGILFIALTAVWVHYYGPRVGSGLWAWVWRHLHFGVRGALAGILVEANTRIDILILGAFSTDAVVGLYSVPAVIAEAVTLAPMALRTNLDPIIGNLIASNDVEGLNRLSREVRRWVWPIAFIGICVLINGFPLFLQLIAPSIQAGEVWKLLAIMMAGIAPSVTVRPFLGILLQAGRPGAYTFVCLGMLLVNTALSFGLIPQYGPSGAAIALSASYAMEFLGMHTLVRSFLGVKI